MPNAKMQNAKCILGRTHATALSELDSTMVQRAALRGSPIFDLEHVDRGARVFLVDNDRGHERNVRPSEELGLNIISGHAGDVAKRAPPRRAGTHGYVRRLRGRFLAIRWLLIPRRA